MPGVWSLERPAEKQLGPHIPAHVRRRARCRGNGRELQEVSLWRTLSQRLGCVFADPRPHRPAGLVAVTVQVRTAGTSHPGLGLRPGEEKREGERECACGRGRAGADLLRQAADCTLRFWFAALVELRTWRVLSPQGRFGFQGRRCPHSCSFALPQPWDCLSQAWRVVSLHSAQQQGCHLRSHPPSSCRRLPLL